MTDFPDIFVLYRSDDGDHWVAHSMRTDQIGVGDDRIEALRELVAALRVLFAESQQDPSLVVVQSAPQEVWEKIASQRAAEIPEAIWEQIRHSGVGCTEADYWEPDTDGGEMADDDTHDVFFRQVQASDLLVTA